MKRWAIFIQNIQFSLKNKNMNGKKEINERGELWVWIFKEHSGWDRERERESIQGIWGSNSPPCKQCKWQLHCFTCVFKLVKHNAIWHSVFKKVIGVILNHFFNCQTLFILDCILSELQETIGMCRLPYGIVPDPSRSFNVLIHPQRFKREKK